MKSTKTYKKIRIHITTYKKDEIKAFEEKSRMNEDKNNTRKNCKKSHASKFICSICLNNKAGYNNHENGKKKVTPCPVCQKSCDTGTVNDIHTPKDKEKAKSSKKDLNIGQPNSKTVQTSETHVGQGLNLLNEVLTVFQSKKHIEIPKENNAKTVIYKDAAVETEFGSKSSFLRPKLTVSKIFQYSIEEEQNQKIRACNMFVVVNSCQPETTKSQFSIKLNKHKSSSIPQMKMEELKKSLKDKTRSKDAIEEVNRMFATVKRNDRYYDTEDDSNRPLLRSGPRVLPVVKTTYEADRRYKKESVSDENVSQHSPRKRVCKCCQTNNYYLSGGDSSRDFGCCHGQGNKGKEKCDKCVYMMCCQFNNHQNKNWKSGVMICEYCGNKNKEDNDEESVTSF